MTSDSPLDFDKPSLFRRLAAILYDSILLLSLLILFSIPWVMLAKNFEFKATWGLRLIAVSILVSFYLYFWRDRQQTLGMTTWRLKLVDSNGLKPNIAQCTIRLCAALFSIACIGLGYLWMLVDKDQMTWHDRLSKTELILLPKKKK